MRTVGRTDLGLVRANNEDAFGIWEDAGLLLVADGMGGHEAGEIASHLATDTIHTQLTQPAALEQPPRRRLAQAVEAANIAVLREARQRRNNMGTTVTVALVLGDRLHVAQLGDSRAYLLRNGVLTQLIDDHSVVQELVTAGLLTPERAESHPHRNVLTRALGQVEGVEVELTTKVLQPDDRLLLCSDGLNSMVPDEEIRRVLLETPDLGDAAQALLDAANERGGNDNITVVLADQLLAPKGKRGLLSYLSPAALLGGLHSVVVGVRQA